MKSKLIAAVLAGSACIAGCEKEADIVDVAENALASLELENVAWLSQRLPAETLAYIRIPPLIQALGAAKGDAAHPAFDNAQSQQEIAKLGDAVNVNLLEQLPEEYRKAARFFLTDAETPLEIALVKPADGSAVPNFILSTRMKDGAIDDISAWTEQLAAAHPQMRSMGAADDAGTQSLLAGPMPMYLQYDPATRQVAAIAGFAATADEVSSLAAAEVSPSALSTYEAKLNDSGWGPALWLAPKDILAFYGAYLPPESQAQMSQFGLDQATSAWFGSVNAKGHSSLRLHIQMPEVAWRQFVPVETAEIPPLKIAGQPSMLMRLSLPTRKQVSALLDLIPQNDPGDKQKLDDGLAELEKLIGFDVLDIFEVTGPDVWLVQDDAGFWAASKIRNKARYDEIHQAMTEKLGVAATDVDMDGTTIKHMSFSQTMFLDEEAMSEMQDAPPWVAGLLEGSKTHVYWVEEGEYTVQAGLPHVLAARESLANGTTLVQYIEDGLDLDWTNSVIALGGEGHNLARDGYYAYLKGLQALSDYAQAGVDITAFPTAQQAGISERGRLALQINSDANGVGLELHYEHSPYDLLSGGNAMAGVAVVGILAAIAIPAYQDYLVRAQVSTALVQASSAKIAVSEHMMSVGGLPTAEEVDQWITGNPFPAGVRFDSDYGAIVIDMYEATSGEIAEGTIYLEPVMDAGAVTWMCYAEGMNSNALPAMCR